MKNKKFYKKVVFLKKEGFDNFKNFNFIFLTLFNCGFK
jgi:hypothetical protein